MCGNIVFVFVGVLNVLVVVWFDLCVWLVWIIDDLFNIVSLVGFGVFIGLDLIFWCCSCCLFYWVFVGGKCGDCLF